MNNKNYPPRARRWVNVRQNNSSRSSGDVVSESNYTKIHIGNHIVGEVHGEVFVKRARGSRHFLRKPPAIAFDIVSLEQAQLHGATTVRVIDGETGIEYRASIRKIYTQGFKFNRGYGEQIGLAFEHWYQGNGPLAEQLALWEDTNGLS